MDELAKKFDGFDAAMTRVLDKLTALEAWKSSSSATMDKLFTQAERTAARIDHIESAPSTSAFPSSTRLATAPPQPPSWWVNPFDLNSAPHMEMHPPASTMERPSGHRVITTHRDAGGGILGSHPPHPVTGTPLDPPAPDPGFMEDSRVGIRRTVPKMDFPKFDGENPRLWKDRCEMYFEVFGVSENMKIRFAALNFDGAAASWLQTLEMRGRVQNWEELCTAVCERFDRDQYQVHMRQLDALRQTGSVAEYYHRFEQLSHSILLYNTSYDDVFFVTRFLHGLKDEISAPIALHCPATVDTASALALLQEEELEKAKMKRTYRHDFRDIHKAGSKGFTTNDIAKSSMKKEELKKTDNASLKEKWQARKEFRRANGLCFTCGEKWDRKHKCPDRVSISVIQELLELFQLDDSPDYTSSEEEETHSVMAVQQSQPVVTSSAAQRKRRTMRFRGLISKIEVLILLDSGSAGTFVSPETAASLKQSVQPCDPLQFSTADGSPMLSTTLIPQLNWCI